MRKGFTLLEVLVATLIMGLAVTGMMTALSTSMRNAARLTDHDRMAMLVDRTLPLEAEFDGGFDPQVTGGEQAGYHVAMSVFEAPPQTPPLTPVLQRIVLHVWWKQGEKQHGFDLEAFRRSVIPAAPL